MIICEAYYEALGVGGLNFGLSSLYVSLPDGGVFNITGSKTWNRTRISHLHGKDKGRVAIQNKISNANRWNVSVDTEVVEPNEET